MTQVFTVRTATVDDAERITELSTVLGYPVTTVAMTARLRHLLAEPDEMVFVAVLPSQDVVGWIHGSELMLIESGRRCEILGLVVDSQHRTSGIGRELVSSVEAWAVSRGMRQIAVRSNVQRIESHPFYVKLGYILTKTQHAYCKALSDGNSV